MDFLRPPKQPYVQQEKKKVFFAVKHTRWTWLYISTWKDRNWQTTKTGNIDIKSIAFWNFLSLIEEEIQFSHNILNSG